MLPKPPIQKKGSLVNNQNKFTSSHKKPGFSYQSVSNFTPKPVYEKMVVQPEQYEEPEETYSPHTQSLLQTPAYQPKTPLPKQEIHKTPLSNFTTNPPLKRPISHQPLQANGNFQQSVQYRQPQIPEITGSNPYQLQLIEENIYDPELTPEQIEQSLANQDQMEHENHNEDEREFVGGKKLYDRQLMQQPMYDEPTMQILNDIASDESFPILVQYITQLSHLGRQAQARLIARASAFQSKNQVFSNINNQNDYMMAQDDFTYAQILSKCDYSTYDTNADYFTAEAIMEAQFNIRLRRSRNALNLLQINTQRQESIMGNSHPQQEEERKLSRKIPFLGQYMGS
jgi:hypothetical protein